jgi:hypothetical protein
MNIGTSQLTGKERRRYSRVAVNREGWLTAQDEKQHFEQITNLSMGGVCLRGKSSFRPGDLCTLKLHEDGRHTTRIIEFCAEVIRASDDTVALKFVQMDVDSYMFLQTIILYNADDPLGIVTEFQDDFPQSTRVGSC